MLAAIEPPFPTQGATGEEGPQMDLPEVWNKADAAEGGFS